MGDPEKKIMKAIYHFGIWLYYYGSVKWVWKRSCCKKLNLYITKLLERIKTIQSLNKRDANNLRTAQEKASDAPAQ